MGIFVISNAVINPAETLWETSAANITNYPKKDSQQRNKDYERRSRYQRCITVIRVSFHHFALGQVHPTEASFLWYETIHNDLEIDLGYRSWLMPRPWLTQRLWLTQRSWFMQRSWLTQRKSLTATLMRNKTITEPRYYHLQSADSIVQTHWNMLQIRWSTN